MKVAIITYHRAYNYGSALQAYAFNKYLRNIGIECETIDYLTERQNDLYRLFEKNKSLLAVCRNIQSFMYLKKLKIHKARFDEFLTAYLPMTAQQYHKPSELDKLNDEYDYFICGSDQIWNPLTVDFDQSYLLSFVKNKKKCVAYAPSVAINRIPDEYNELFFDSLQNYKALSTREKSGSNIISNIVGRKCEVVVDPVLLLSPKEWSDIAEDIPYKDYILGYYIGNVDGMRGFADKLRNKTGKRVIVIYKNLRDFKYKTVKAYDAGPREFVGLVRNASYIVTNSFHAAVFSLIFKKNFWVFTDSNNPNSSGSRIENILEVVGMSNRILDAATMNKINPEDEIEYTEQIEYSMECIVQLSKEYIMKGLNDEAV